MPGGDVMYQEQVVLNGIGLVPVWYVVKKVQNVQGNWVHFYEMDIHLFKQTVIKCHFLIIKSDWIRDFSVKMKCIDS